MNGRRIILLSLLLALISTIAFSLYTRPSQTAVSEVESVKVVVAKADISKNTVITEDMVILKSFPKTVLPAGIELKTEQVLGKIASEAIMANEPLVKSRLVDPNSDAATITYKIPKGKRAVSLSYNEVMGVGGFIRPGDYVDLIGTFDPEITKSTINQDVSKILLQKVLVLAVGSKKQEGVKSDTPENAPLTTITLAVTPQEAEVLTFAEERGSVRLLLRGIEDDAKVSTPGTTNTNVLQPR